MIQRIGLFLVVACVSLYSLSALAQGDRGLKEGRFYVDGQWVFLKIAKPLRNFGDAAACEKLIANLPTLKEKHYNCITLNCYWHHFDFNGDGVIDVSLDPLVRLVKAIDAAGMYPALSTETYGVGGGTVPKGFWEKHPDAIAINSRGKKVMDTEYGFGTAVPSFFSPDYLRLSRSYVRNLCNGLPHELFIYYETTVEPQFIGNQAIDFSDHGKRAWEAFRAKHPEAPVWPKRFPVRKSFLKDVLWNQFRAEALAQWVNEDAAIYRSVVGPKALIAVDYLETNGPEMPNRNGDSRLFLEKLTCANIIQVNWHWHLGARGPNQIAYDNVRAVMKAHQRDWAITEHMTLNGSDYSPKEAPAMLRNALAQGTGFGWEFVDVGASSTGAFSHYNDDWTPKPLIAVVDEQWAMWAKEIQALEKRADAVQ